MEKLKVLFVCIHNSARSQMAEELLRKIAGDRFEVESAGLEPGNLIQLLSMLLRKRASILKGNKQKQSLNCIRLKTVMLM